jgi:acetyl esterase/lipase
LSAALVTAPPLIAEEGPARPVFEASGDVQVPSFVLPPSSLMSDEGREMQKLRARMPARAMQMEPDIAKSRAGLSARLAPQVEQVLAAYPVEVVETRIGGVPVREVTPQGRETDPDRVLINLHGGAFSVCWDSCSLLESAPVASLGNFRVISVNYRMAPEARHPAGVEDVAAVYRALLEDYDSGQIGIYGCSAGGALTAQAAAYLPMQELPQAGAVGIFGAGAVRMRSGDSAYIAAYIDGSFPAPAAAGEPALDLTRGYFAGADMGDAVISPALHPDILGKFPPSLVITGTRAMDMSPAVFTNSQLLKAGVPSSLVVAEGMGHCYLYSPQLPEARDAHELSVRFFREHLR